MRRSVSVPLGLAGFAAAGLAYSVVESRLYTLRRVSVPVLPAGADPLRVLHLSDLHLTPWQRREVDWVRGLAALEPDLVVDTGDNLAHLGAVPTVLDALGRLLDVPGAFVLGSNDYYAPKVKNPARYLQRHGGERRIHGHRLPTDHLVEAFTDAGWVDLSNTRARLTVRGLDLELVGVDDPHIERDRYDAVAGPAARDADLTLGVLHAPYQRVLDPMTADGARLVLAGHTHGGQLAVPGYGALVTNCDLPRSRAKGLSRWWPGAGSAGRQAPPDDAAWLHVSAGLGTSPYTPVRFACRPEATLLTLVPGTASS